MQVAVEGVAKRAEATVLVVVVLSEDSEKAGPFAEHALLL